MFDTKQKSVDAYNREHARFLTAMKAEGMKLAQSVTKDQSKKVNQFIKKSYTPDNA